MSKQQGRGGMGSHKHGVSGRSGPSPRAKLSRARDANAEPLKSQEQERRGDSRCLALSLRCSGSLSPKEEKRKRGNELGALFVAPFACRPVDNLYS